MYSRNQNFIVRLTEKRKLFWRGKWFKSTTLRDSRKGKIKTTLTFKEGGRTRRETVYISHLNIKITANKRPITLVLVYGLGATPMMLATNRHIDCKEKVIQVLRDYMSRWRVEEYFRFKKQHFDFENFRVRSLDSIRNLNRLLTFAIGLVGLLANQKGKSLLTRQLIHNAKALRGDIHFLYYQVAEGIASTLAYAREGIRRWFFIRRNEPQQLEMKLAV